MSNFYQRTSARAVSSFMAGKRYLCRPLGANLSSRPSTTHNPRFREAVRGIYTQLVVTRFFKLLVMLTGCLALALATGD